MQDCLPSMPEVLLSHVLSSLYPVYACHCATKVNVKMELVLTEHPGILSQSQKLVGLYG